MAAIGLGWWVVACLDQAPSDGGDSKSSSKPVNLQVGGYGRYGFSMFPVD